MSIGKISTIEELIKALDYGSDYDSYSGLIKSLDLLPTAVTNYCSWNKDNYTRNLITQRDTYELLVMCWEEKQKTPIHSFDQCEGWSYIIDGELSEDLYSVSKDNTSTSKKIFSQKLLKGTCSYLHDDMGFHRYTNTNGGRTISLHLFSKPINEWVIFNEETKCIEKQDVKSNSMNILS